ncbi:uncharacterized protein TNCV_984551 [Trichonephila clavipes]|nr:uncharacterized protein TNCV_984551 [Trichonephila clavipes]
MDPLSESSEFLHIAHSIKFAISSSEKVLLSSGKSFSFAGFNERRSHSRSHLCPNGFLTNIVVKRVLAAGYCVFINGDRTQLMPTPSGVNIEAISSSPCIFLSVPGKNMQILYPGKISCRCIGTIVDLLGGNHSFTLPALLELALWCFSGIIRLLLRSLFQSYKFLYLN